MDVSAPMLTLARSRASALPNARFLLDDAATARFDDTFDVVLSRFGVMFFVDPVAAFENIARATRPRGRLVLVCWQELAASEWFTLPLTAARSFLPASEPAPPDAPGPGSFADRERVESILSRAGFVDVDLAPCESAVPIGTDVEDALAQLRRIGPLSRALAEMPPDAAERAVDAVRSALHGISDRQPLTLSARYWLVRAIRR